MNNLDVMVSGTIMRAEGLLVSDMGGEKVMMSIQSGKYYNLGQSGGVIWEHLAVPTTVTEIVNKICEEYDIDREACVGQVSVFLQQLAEQGLIVSTEV
ncbi:lasso peptide biosynthesis PqqD family chaperone [Paenibacillus sp. YAF4_2]|uniref:lasso peptide biosynthesis PqqD family chaperone n=1 Tax=Paenibacillus sp. YAF4_2 TaxID=3233085 RepID=UPI003F9B4BF3